MLTELAFAFGRIVATEARGALKSILANLELSDEGDSSSDEPMYVVPGFYCRPMPPVEDGAGTGLEPEGECEVFAIRLGDEVVPVGYRDLRLNAQVNPDEGELGLAHYGGGFISMKWNADSDGTDIVLYAPRKDSSGTAVAASAILIDSADGNQHICLMHEKGQSITLTKDEDILLVNKAGDAYVQVGSSSPQVVLNGAAVAITGGVMLGDKNPALGDEVMLSTGLLAWVAEVNTALAAADTQLKALGAAGLTIPTSTPLAATQVKGI